MVHPGRPTGLYYAMKEAEQQAAAAEMEREQAENHDPSI